MGLATSNDLIKEKTNHLQVYPATGVLVNSKCHQVDNQEQTSQVSVNWFLDMHGRDNFEVSIFVQLSF